MLVCRLGKASQRVFCGNVQAHPLNHIVGRLEFGQDGADVSLIIGPFLESAEAALHGLHGEAVLGSTVATEWYSEEEEEESQGERERRRSSNVEVKANRADS